MAFGVGPMLTMAAVDSLAAYGSRGRSRRTYLPKLISGEWMGTMQLTEPQAGSDVGALRTRAERAGDGTYRLTGTKIFITYGEHDLTDNIVHFVLARVAGAPHGTRGLSLFLVPKFLVNPDGTLGARNDVRAHSVEHKLGIHGSPTCVMVYGDRGGAIGYLVGEEDRGMAAMFTMMNEARLAVGLQGVGVAEAATQRADAYARERRQGRVAGMEASATVPIIAHVDVRRMLLTMRALTRAARTICYATAVALDRAHLAGDAAARKAGAGARRPAHPGRQGVLHRHRQRGRLARHPGPWRHGLHRGDRRRAALSRRPHRPDLRGHQRHPGDRPRHPQGADVRRRRGQVLCRRIARHHRRGAGHQRSGLRRHRDAARRGCRQPRARHRLAARALASRPDAALAGATPYLRLFGTTAGGCMLAGEALAAARQANGGVDKPGRIAIARFFAENIAVAGAGALAAS